jgi:hypothetical protein
LAWDLPSLDRAKVFAVTSPVLGDGFFGHDKGKFTKLNMFYLSLFVSDPVASAKIRDSDFPKSTYPNLNVAGQ